MTSGPLYAALSAARLMIADTWEFRRLADPDSPWNQATALEHVHIDALPPPAASEHTLVELQALRPFALIWLRENAGLTLHTDSAVSSGGPMVNGIIVVRLEMDVDEDLADDPRALALDVNGRIGRLLRTGNDSQPGLWDLNFVENYLPMNRTVISGPVRTHEDDSESLGDAVMWEIEIEFGT